MLDANQDYKKYVFPASATTDFEGKVIYMSNPTKLNSMFEVKTNVQTKQIVSKMRIKNKLQEDMGLINPDKHNSHDLTDNLDPSTFLNPTER